MRGSNVFSERETATLAEMLGRLRWPVAENVFIALCGATVTVPIELAVKNQEDKFLLVQRPHDDPFYPHQWHLPGTIMRVGDTLETCFKRLHAEVGHKIRPPTFLTALHIEKGMGPFQNPRGQEVSQLYTTEYEGHVPETARFVSPFEGVTGLIEHHKQHMEVLRKWLSES